MAIQQVINLKAFRKANKLTQAQLAEIIGTSRSFIGQIECGSSKMPDIYLQNLLTNDNYDTSMLVVMPEKTAEPKKASTDIEIENKLLSVEVESLKAQLAKAEAEKEKYWEMIQKLMK